MTLHDEDNFPFVARREQIKDLDFSKALIIKDSITIAESEDKKEGVKSNFLLEFSFKGFGDQKVFDAIQKLNKSDTFMDLTREEGNLLYETLIHSIRRMKQWPTAFAEVTERVEEEE